MKLSRLFVLAPLLAAVLLTACSGINSDPGPIEGSWKTTDFVANVTHFRNGEVEELGHIYQARYNVDGDAVTMTYASGPKEGTAIKFTVIDDKTLSTSFGYLKRVN